MLWNDLIWAFCRSDLQLPETFLGGNFMITVLLYTMWSCINQPSLAANVFLLWKDLGLKQDRQHTLQFDYGYLLALAAWCFQTLCMRQLISQHKQVEIHLETLSLYSAAQLQQVPEGECVKSHASLMLLVSAAEQSPQCWISSFLYIEQVEHEERGEK